MTRKDRCACAWFVVTLAGMLRMIPIMATAIVLGTGQHTYGGWLSDWKSYNGHLYRLTSLSTWSAAEAQAVSVGGHLVTINNAQENQWLYDTFMSLSPVYSGNRVLWIGLHQATGSVEPAGGWGWTSGEPVTYTNWNNGEPNNYSYYGAENCGSMWSLPPTTWNDYPNAGSLGHEQFPGVVEMVPEPVSLALLAFGGLVAIRRVRS